VDGQRALPLLQYAARRLDDRRVIGLIARIEDFRSMLASTRRAGVAPEGVPESRPQPALEIFAFGKGTVFRDSSPVTQSDWGAAQARELFFYILAHPNRSKEQIGAIFWPDLSLARMTSTFHATLYRVRRAVGRECILYEDEQYRFNRGLNYWLDVEEFSTLLAGAGTLGTRSEAASECSRKAIALYRGDYLEDVYSDWATLERESLLRRFVEAVIKLATFLVEKKEYGPAEQLYRELLEKDNLREDVHRQLMECYVRAGDRGKALQHYVRLVTLLDKELAARPAPETVVLYEQILRAA
jgi:two-component SAPR family response regulator